jgi:hypothetical protein
VAVAAVVAMIKYCQGKYAIYIFGYNECIENLSIIGN